MIVPQFSFKLFDKMIVPSVHSHELIVYCELVTMVQPRTEDNHKLCDMGSHRARLLWEPKHHWAITPQIAS